MLKPTDCSRGWDTMDENCLIANVCVDVRAHLLPQTWGLGPGSSY